MNSNNIPSNISSSTFRFNPRDGLYFDISESINEKKSCPAISSDNLSLFEELDLIFRTLCGVLYNFVPTSGHPGGSISSGRFVSNIVYNSLAYDLSNPNSEMNDTIVYAAGHKALGLYSMLALRNELVRISKPALLPKDQKLQLRFEDLLGFRRNPITGTPLFNKFRAKPLDGHPTPSIPFVSLATGASGIGAAASFGLALGSLDRFGEKAPKIHVVEGEGGMTPGRMQEAMAAASYARLYNLVMHVDFNQASIESNHVCRDGTGPGDYVQWTPAELGFLHDWNVIKVQDGMDFRQIAAAQSPINGRP